MNVRERLNDVQHILADDLKELIAEYFEKMYPSANHLLAMQLAFYLADHGVTVQKHGRWNKPSREFYWRPTCSECGFAGSIYDEPINPFNYCPNCGAKMIEGKEE